MTRLISLVGTKYKKLLVVKQVKERSKHKEVLYECLCDCGNVCVVSGNNLKTGNSGSCGCFRKEQTKKKNTKDIVDKKFGRLLVIERTSKRVQRSVVWKCLCNCGNIVYVSSSHLRSGHTKSCGCQKTEKSSSDLLGKTFGYLTVIKKTNKRKSRSILWLCYCRCGRHTEVTSQLLNNGKRISCGCIKSKGENKIEKFLIINNISFKKEHTFEKCKDVGKLRFDFYLPVLNCVIEYNGEQHYTPISIWGGKKELKLRKKRDMIKKNFCIENNIKMIEIPYWNYEDMEEILSSKLNILDV